MADPNGFLKTRERESPKPRPVSVRLRDWKEVYAERDSGTATAQAARCMDCGVPFCMQGCPLGNLIPEFNDLIYRDDWQAASERLHSTNNFPEFTGLLCPAPCESSCVLGINQPAVTIKQSEAVIAEVAMKSGLVVPLPPDRLTGKTVAVVGSGPAGLAAAQQLTRVGHTVAVYEKDEEPGGLLRYGIPDFKLEKERIDLRVKQMEAEGTRFRLGVTVGIDPTWDEIRERYDAVVVAIGAGIPRDISIPGREMRGIHLAMDYLTQANRCVAGDAVETQITAKDKRVIILGGGDTGADCLGTALRQGAKSVQTLAIGVRPPDERTVEQPWPLHPNLFEVQSSHEEGGERSFLASTVAFEGNSNGELTGLLVAETNIDANGLRTPKTGSEQLLSADLVLLALGFNGPDMGKLKTQLAIDETAKGLLAREENFSSNLPGVFVIGDAGRGASLIVWAIAEGRSVAARVDEYLMGSSTLPNPISAHSMPIHF